MPFADVRGQDHAIELLRRGLAHGRLHHALLFFGPDGVGKELAAFGLACAVACTVKPNEGCGSCDACRRVLTASSSPPHVPLHPDVVVVERGLYPKDVLGRSTDEKTDISVDQIRRVVLSRVLLPPNEARERIIIVRHAEELSVGAANSLLKTLEEPPAHTRFVLITARPGELLPTIHSRAQPIRFVPLADDVVASILTWRGTDAARANEVAPLAGGSVEAAIELADPEGSARAAAVDALRRATEGSLVKLLETTSAYGNSGEDRERLRHQLELLTSTEAIDLRRFVRAGDDAAIARSLARHAAARTVIEMLEKNANVPLALEGAWVKLR